MKKKQQQQQQSIDETSIPKSIRLILARCPKLDSRPVICSEWAEELVTESRNKGISNKLIEKWIVEYGTNNNWGKSTIGSILADNGLKAISVGIGGGQREFKIQDIQKLIESLTGLDESGLLRAGDSRDDLERKSSSHILKTVISLEEFDVNHWLAQFKTLGTVVDIYVDSLRNQKTKLKRSIATV